MAVAVVALFLALTGSVVAATKLAKNSVGSSQIKNGSVKGGDLVDNTITGEQVLESSLGVVPRAATAGTATAAGAAQTAQTARTADRATSAGTADRAGSAGNADQLAGHPPSDFVPSQSVFVSSARLYAGESHVLAERDGVRLIARCVSGASTITGDTADVLTIVAETSSSGATQFSTLPAAIDDNGNIVGSALEPGQQESDRVVARTSAKTGVRVWRMLTRSPAASSPGGATIFLGASTGIRVGFNVPGATCTITAPVTISG